MIVVGLPNGHRDQVDTIEAAVERCWYNGGHLASGTKIRQCGDGAWLVLDFEHRITGRFAACIYSRTRPELETAIQLAQHDHS